MKALYFEKTGSLDFLKLTERPFPSPRTDEAVVQIKAAAINPSDPKIVLGKMSDVHAPRIPGRDFSGIVVEGPPEWKGKEVLGTGSGLGAQIDGTHAQFASVPVDALVEKPKGLSFETAAGLGLSYLTAWAALVDAGKISKNDTVLILGAAGAVGSSAVKIAKYLGARRIIGTLRNGSERSRIRGVPADDWIELDRSQLSDSVLQLTQGRGVDLALDVIGGPLFEPVNRSMALNARHVVLATNPAEVTFNLLNFYHQQTRLIGLDTLKFTTEEITSTLKRILPLVAEGALTVPEAELIPIERAIEAYRMVSEGTAPKKFVIRME